MNRIGLLDRKLRIISENTNNENPKTIVINNNININFNNKIEKSNIYERDKNEIGKKQATTKISESKEFFSK